MTHLLIKHLLCNDAQLGADAPVMTRGLLAQQALRRQISNVRFARMDANADGYVDAAERAAMPQRPMRRGMGGTPTPTPPSDA